MSSYSYTGIVSKAETEALKELIFNRARQRAENLAKDTQEKYTSSFREDIMDIARNSFNSPGNPFAQKTELVHNENQKVRENQPQVKERHNDIGFKQRTTENNIKEIIKFRNDLSKEKIANNEISGIMQQAGAEFTTSKNFTGALEFLNSQASIYMAGERKAKFDTIA